MQSAVGAGAVRPGQCRLVWDRLRLCDQGGGSYHVTVSAGSTPLATRVVDTFFFIAALPRPACSYRELSVTAISTDVTGLPPDITRSLDDDPTQLTTTTRFGACRPHALVTATSESGESQGR